MRATMPSTVSARLTPPVPSSVAVRLRLQRQPSRDTPVEVAFRQLLHRRGLRFRVHRRPLPQLARVADVVFPRHRVAVFVDGCFWHGCPEHLMWPKSNAAWGRDKITGNQRRDHDTDVRLAESGWAVFRTWEHDDPSVAAEALAALLAKRLPEKAR
ncbi:MAG: very short patch repair endonuclease [Pseudonocardiaceae bacterium]